MGLLGVEQIGEVKLTARPPMVTPALVRPRPAASRSSRSRRKLWLFFGFETFALLVLILLLTAGTSPILAQENLTTPLGIMVGIATGAVAIIPIGFYGLPRRGYRIRRY